MQNWESMPQANYEHNWYGNMFAGIKREPMSATSYPMDHHNHHSGLQKSTASMDINFGSPTSPTSHHTQQQQQQMTESLEGHSFYGLSNNNHHHPLGFNPLTPPGYPNAVIPQMGFNQELGFSDSSATPSTTTAASLQKENHINSYPMEHAQSLTPSHTPPMDITPPKSPKSLPATPEKDNEMSSNSNDSGEDTRFPDSDNDDETICKPKFNSHGKVKKYKCKQCGYVAITKVDFWAHAETHIKPEKLLKCGICPFVTELKHHLEYHVNKHRNLKPFQCDQCSYTCVNKSMLNSHLKSHSKVYQYRCADCDYATKYCHSFKLHLRKYTHKPGMVLNDDGTPNPMITIDVYGTRRGPKMKGRDGSNVSSRKINQEIKSLSQSAINATKKPSEPQMTAQSRIPPVLNNQPVNMMSNLIPSTLANMLQQSRGLPFFPYLNLNLQMLAAQQQAVLAQMSPNVQASQSIEGDRDDERMSRFDSDGDDGAFDDADHNSNHNAMDLTRNSPSKSLAGETDLMHAAIISEPKRFGSPTSADSITDTPILSSTSSKLSRRKGRAFKLDSAGHEEEDEEHDAPVQHTKLTLGNFSDDAKSAKNGDRSTPLSNGSSRPSDDSAAGRLTPKDTYECKSCGIYFRDAVLHSIHMGYHSCDDEFRCNMCGEKCGDRLTFFLHIARFPHS